ncbi:hypothetical protein GC197_06040 [bacterium]|nr:hypothetical protein [bacterium]
MQVRLLILVVLVLFGGTKYLSQWAQNGLSTPQPTNETTVSISAPDESDLGAQLAKWNKDVLHGPDEVAVVRYLKENGRLPDSYITKHEARNLGWDAAKGNLQDVAPGKSIGGDKFMNREGDLPNSPARQYFEADLNYHGGHRGAERLIYSNDGLMFVTRDHYHSFHQVKTKP